MLEMENFALAWPNLLWQTEDYMKGLSFAVLKVTLGVTSLWPCLIPGLQGSRNQEAFSGVEGTCSLCLKSDYFTPIAAELIMRRISKQWANLEQDFVFLLGEALAALSQRVHSTTPLVQQQMWLQQGRVVPGSISLQGALSSSLEFSLFALVKFTSCLLRS